MLKKEHWFLQSLEPAHIPTFKYESTYLNREMGVIRTQVELTTGNMHGSFSAKLVYMHFFQSTTHPLEILQ